MNIPDLCLMFGGLGHDAGGLGIASLFDQIGIVTGIAFLPGFILAFDLFGIFDDPDWNRKMAKPMIVWGTCIYTVAGCFWILLGPPVGILCLPPSLALW